MKGFPVNGSIRIVLALPRKRIFCRKRCPDIPRPGKERQVFLQDPGHPDKGRAIDVIRGEPAFST